MGPLWQPCRRAPPPRSAPHAGRRRPGSAPGGLTAYAAWEARQYTLREVSVPLLPAGHRPLRVLHLSDIHMTPGQTRKQAWLREPGRARARPGDRHRRQPRPPRRGAGRARRPRRPARRAGRLRVRLQRLLRAELRNPLRYLLPDDGSRNIDTPELPWRDLGTRFVDAGWLRPDQQRGSLTVGTRRSPWPASTTRTCLRRPGGRGRPGRPRRRRAPRRRARAVPPCARPVRRRRVRRDLRRAHPRRPGVPARVRRAGHQLRPRAAPGPRGCTGTRPTPDPGTRLVVAARLGRAGHQPVRPDPGRLPPRGDPADATTRPGRPDRPLAAADPISDGSDRSGMLAVLRSRSPVRSGSGCGAAW